jgi:hypothetical protein
MLPANDTPSQRPGIPPRRTHPTPDPTTAPAAAAARTAAGRPAAGRHLAARRRAVPAVALAAACAVALAGCSQDVTDKVEGQSAQRPAGAAEALKGHCPDTVVVQTNWWPQAEYGGLYRLLGKDAVADKAKKSVSGPLVAAGVDTGVKIEIRSGGPSNGFTPAAKILYLDRSVTLGGTDIDQAAQFSRDQPVQAVFAPMDLSPLVLMWDPQAHPGFKTIVDIGQTDTRVLYYQGSTYMEYLVGSGILRKKQVEPAYDGSPTRFVAERGQPVQQGYLTNEVFQYEKELPQWRKRVSWQLVSDSGYPVYPETLTIRPDRKAELSGCLKRLVPVLQRSTVDYANDPKATNALLVKLVKDFGAFPYSAERAAYAVEAMKKNGIIGNGSNGTVGDFDGKRVQKIVDIVKPIFAAQRKPVRDGIKAEDLFTNEFVDPSIGVQQ